MTTTRSNIVSLFVENTKATHIVTIPVVLSNLKALFNKALLIYIQHALMECPDRNYADVVRDGTQILGPVDNPDIESCLAMLLLPMELNTTNQHMTFGDVTVLDINKIPFADPDQKRDNPYGEELIGLARIVK